MRFFAVYLFRHWRQLLVAIDSVCFTVGLGIEFDDAEVVPRFIPNVIARPAINSWPELN